MSYLIPDTDLSVSPNGDIVISHNLSIAGSITTAGGITSTTTTAGFLPPRLTTTQRNVVSAPPPGVYNFYRAITVDHTKVGTVGSTDQTNFPVLVSITDATLATVANGGNVQNSSGFDIVFSSDAAGTSPLFWEMESYAPTTGAVVAWVLIPTLSHTTDTVFYMSYGNAAISTFQSVASSVWDANFQGVYHLGLNAALSLADSTTNARNATNTNVVVGAGKIAKSGDFGTGGTAWLTCGSAGDFSSIAAAGTYSSWFYCTDTSIFNSIITNQNFRTDRSGIGLFAATGSKLYYEIASASGNEGTFETNALATATTWHLGVLTWDGSTVNMYVDGVVDYSGSQTHVPVVTTYPMLIGAVYDSGISSNNTGFHGLLDEARISSTARSADWIVTEYNNQSAPSTFSSLGTEIPVVPAGASAKKKASMFLVL